MTNDASLSPEEHAEAFEQRNARSNALATAALEERDALRSLTFGLQVQTAALVFYAFLAALVTAFALAPLLPHGVTATVSNSLLAFIGGGGVIHYLCSTRARHLRGRRRALARGTGIFDPEWAYARWEQTRADPTLITLITPSGATLGCPQRYTTASAARVSARELNLSRHTNVLAELDEYSDTLIDEADALLGLDDLRGDAS